MNSQPKRYLFTVTLILTGLMIMGAFQNCVTLNNHKDKYSVMQMFPSSDRFPASEIKRRNSDLNQMLQSSNNEINQTRGQLDRHLQNEGGFDARNRKLANSYELESEYEMPKAKDKMKLKLKKKRKK